MNATYTTHTDPVTVLNQEANQWSMFVHFSVFAGYFAPILGFILPIILWQVKKDRFPLVDQQGKIVVNWILSCIIYSIACFLLSFILVGFALFGILLLLSIIYPIIGGIKANNGEVWAYPFSIRFLR